MAHELRMGDDGILRVALIGEIGQTEWQTYFQKVSLYVKAAATEGRQLPIIVDVRRAGRLRSEARKSITDISDESGHLKVAVVGVSPYVRFVATIISKAQGRGPANLFASEDDALLWIKEGS